MLAAVARTRSSDRRLVGLEVGLLASCLAKAAFAFPTSRLVYARGPGTEQCPDAAVVRDAVASRLGYDPFFPNSDKVIVARVLRNDKELRGQVELVDEHGAELGLREISAKADECAELVRAMALTISIAIDPKSAETYAQGPRDEAALTVPDEPLIQPKTAAEPPRASEPRSGAALGTAPPVYAPRVRASAGVGLMGVLGVAPKPTALGFAFARLRKAAWSAALEGGVDLPVSDERAGLRFRTISYALRAVPCLHWRVVFVCEVTSLGWLAAEGKQPTGESGTSAFWSLGGRVGAEVMFDSTLGLIGQADFLVNTRTVEIESGGHPLWHTKRFNGEGGFALSLHFL